MSTTMPEVARRPIRLVAMALVTAAVSVPVPISTSGASAEPVGEQERRPLVAYATEDGVRVVDGHGELLSTTARTVGGFSLGGDLLAVVRRAGDGLRTVGHDARSGERRFRIDHTLVTPTVLQRGSSVAFSGGGVRDPYATSLWLRGKAGRERRLIQFSFGGSPGVPTGISEGVVLEYSFSERAEVVAVAAGDDILDFDYDIWSVDVATGSTVRITNNRSSRYPAVSPDGGRVAYFREDSICGGPLPGYRGGDLVTVDPDGSDRRVLHDGDCDRYLTRPRWLSRDLLVAVLHTRRDASDPEPLYSSQVVVIDVDRGYMSEPISETDRVGDISVSPSSGRIAYNDWTDPEGFWVHRWRSDWQGTTTYVDEGWAPHLRGDHTSNPTY